MSVYRTNILILLAAFLMVSGCVEVDAPPDSRSFSDGVIYVSPEGLDIDPGTREAPFRTVRKAMLVAAEGGASSVRVATGSYGGAFALVGGVDLLGGLDPVTWLPADGEYSELGLQNVPVTGQGIRLDTCVRSLIFSARPPHGDDRFSTHALYLVDCGDNLRFENCRFVSAGGKSGTDGEDGDMPHERELDYFGTPGGSGACADSVDASGGENWFTGGGWGSGGDGGSPGLPGQDGSQYGFSGSDIFAAGGPGGAIGQPGGDGETGAIGTAGEHGLAAELVGIFSDFEFKPQSGSSGSRGYEGRGGGGGGGGGGSFEGTGNGGGSGGYGGRSGDNGSGAMGGGHSLTVICRSVSAIFADCHFTAGPGGKGGDGGNGGEGGPGAPGGPGGSECTDQVGAGGKGGDGGRGGHGGGGAGGHGGWSYCLYMDGTGAPVFQGDCLFSHDQPGIAGTGGLTGDGVTRAEDGQPGQSGEFWPVAVPAASR